jgi:hypothetical protein
MADMQKVKASVGKNDALTIFAQFFEYTGKVPGIDYF